jgi:hypothetical protein
MLGSRGRTEAMGGHRIDESQPGSRMFLLIMAVKTGMS